MNHGRDSIYLNIDDDDNIDKKTNKEVFRMINRRFSFIDVGYSYRLTEMEAALGLEQLRFVKQMVRKRQKNARYLINGLEKFSERIQLPSWPQDREHDFLGFPMVIKDGRIKRAELITYLEKRGIETRYLMPLTNQPIYKKIFGNIENYFPVAKNLNHSGFYIGCHHRLGKEDLDYIIEAFRSFIKK